MQERSNRFMNGRCLGKAFCCLMECPVSSWQALEKCERRVWRTCSWRLSENRTEREARDEFRGECRSAKPGGKHANGSEDDSVDGVVLLVCAAGVVGAPCSVHCAAR